MRLGGGADAEGRAGGISDAAEERRARLLAAKRSSGDDVRSQRHLLHGGAIRDELAGVPAATEAEIQQLGVKFGRRLAELQPDPHTRSFFVLFKDVDRDGSGRIEYGELLSVVRFGLGIGKAELPDRALKSLWIALDRDESGSLEAAEFGSMMKLTE